MARVGLNALVLRTDASYRNAGPSRYATNLIQALLSQPRTNHFTIFLNEQVRGLPFTPAQPVRVLRTKAPTSRTGVRVLWEHLLAPWQIATARLDVVHSLLNVVPLAAPTRHVVTVHDLSFMRVPGAHPTHRRWYLTAATWLSARRAKVVLADSRATRDDVVELLGVHPDRVHVVYPGREAVFHPRPDARVDAFRRDHGVDKPFVLFVGTLEPRKNVDVLVRAFGLAARNGLAGNLVIAGGRGWATDAIDAAIADSPVRRRIRRIGYVKQEDLPYWYCAADLVVYPSSYEGFGIPVLEAMASGTPVITSNRSSLPEVGGDAALAVDPRDAAQLAATMSAVLQSPERRARMSKLGLVQAQRFDWTVAAEQCLSLYRRALDPS
ncbi:MAG: glycosyltransferase family 1 protein [Chloroflexi bacterium]|nr:glycosyltransferase family 1 protein [Chloroflexota bacterium]